ncbi:MAG: glycosyl hydrolase family protein [Micrococcales bacterium]|nr:glycosyl hydrolase family protein [Microbacteriaceae bacterium]NBR22630.1 glycosyl hydrolase family protein [Micrococcales bacterium]NBX94509.1 glycosyl hydrolase family protein [Actinomycetota bacterium]NBR77982.1 glycosyl hydrolase family protein [Microbacteriaceae bacterium]NBS60533.1 glycosyl hydrolase family protein [Microbacteriaceae bacterium]
MSKNFIRTVWVAILLLSSSSGLVANAIAPSNYSIRFDANAGIGTMPVVKVPTTGKALPASKFTRDGFQFAGWAINPNGVVKYKDKAVLKPKSKLTLFARWTSIIPTPELLHYSVGKLLWSESFSGPAQSKVSNANWTTRYCGHSAANGGGSCFGESQYYTPDAIALDGSEQGNAVITTTRVTRAPANSGPCLAAPCRFVSGRFDTQGKVSFKYGYIEARIKMPVGGGNWPAFWALGDSITEVGWPLSGEIDIAEQGGDRPTRNSSAVHYSNQDIATCCDNHRYVVGDIVDEANYQSEYHTYGIAWTPDLMQFYVDRELFFTVFPGNVGEHHWVFNEPFFLILNNATGPFGGDYTGWQTSETKIDYVRAWQLDGHGAVITR